MGGLTRELAMERTKMLDATVTKGLVEHIVAGLIDRVLHSL
jgi:hypothetical protein